MNRQPYQVPPKWWPPKLSPLWMKVWRPFRIRKQHRIQRLTHVETLGQDHLGEALSSGAGVLITPNHPTHADAYAMYGAADAVGTPFYFMAAWQVFGKQNWLHQTILRHHGVFSVDREGIDRRAMNQAIEILQSAPQPLVIFPEGEVYHINDRTTPFREGPATIALFAAKKAKRPIVCVPCGLKYHYIDDPTPDLLQIMDRLERHIFWRPQSDMPLHERIYRFAEGPLALKELEFLGQPSSGPLTTRAQALTDTILSGVEQRHGAPHGTPTIPERVKSARQRIIKQLSDLSEDDLARQALLDDLDDIFLAVQLFSYPGDYVAEQPSVERMAETLDKFEEDVLGVSTATIRGARRATVLFGEPIPVELGENRREAGAQLTQTLENRVQGLVDDICQGENTAGATDAASPAVGNMA